MSEFSALIGLSTGMVLAMVSCSPIPSPLPEIQIPTSSTNPMTNNHPDFNIAGKVQEMGVSEIIILSPENQNIHLHIPDQSRIWDGIEWVAEIPIEVGDDVVATGVWEENSSVFIVQSLYINIVQLRGVAGEIDKENLQLKLDDPRQGVRTVIIDARTEVYLLHDNRQGAYQELQVLPETGEYIEVIGRQLKDGTVLSVNITIP